MGLYNDSITCDRTYTIIVFNDKFKQTYAIIVFNDKFKQTIRLKRALSTLISENSVACDRILLFELFNWFG